MIFTFKEGLMRYTKIEENTQKLKYIDFFLIKYYLIAKQIIS